MPTQVGFMVVCVWSQVFIKAMPFPIQFFIKTCKIKLKRLMIIQICGLLFLTIVILGILHQIYIPIFVCFVLIRYNSGVGSGGKCYLPALCYG